MNAITQISTLSTHQAATSVSPLGTQATAQNDISKGPKRAETLAMIEALKSAGQDYEFYPSTEEQITLITDDVTEILKTHEFSSRYDQEVKVLDIGAGDGRVLQQMKSAIEANQSERFTCELYAIEKATPHIDTYRTKGITLLGTEFNEVNFISKQADIAFVNSPYSDFSHWMTTLIGQLNFGLMYAIMPERWQEDPSIQEVIERRLIKSVKVLAKSDYLDAHRQARAKVEIVRFAFNDFEKEGRKTDDPRFSRYKPLIGRDSTDSFQIFLRDELGLHHYSGLTNQFHEHVEMERVREEIQTEGTECYELAVSRGVLGALLDNYERDLSRVLGEYKKICAMDASLLKELGVEYKTIREGVKQKLFGFRNVYWSLLFDELDVLSRRLTSKHKTHLLNTLAANALDFTHKNAVYVISFAVEMANELIESSLIDVFTELTSEKSIQRHYKSNEHVYLDRFRHNSESPNKHARYVLDYRFISSYGANFSSDSWKRGLIEGARRFCDDLVVALRLIGYDQFTFDKAYDDIEGGDKLVIGGVDATGKAVDLLHIRFYLNGNRHIKFNKEAILRLNCTVSRLLGWVRSKAEFEQETECKKPINEKVWQVGDNLKVQPSTVLALTHRKAS
ncbi:DUF4942 domain-containing protein [Vibrio pectenicida]|uniref:DUF4942 domain-containing protein n=1 Tax=Vibrio pectenicida TaxID=62763 RepID=UPI003B9C4432